MAIANTTLGFERGVNPRQQVRHTQLLEQLWQLAAGNGALDDDQTARDLAQKFIEVRIFQLHNLRTLSRLAKGGEPGPQGSIAKLYWSEMSQRFHRTVLDVLGDAAPLWVGADGQSGRRQVAAVLALLPRGNHHGRHQRGAAQHHRRARAGPASGAVAMTGPLEGVRVLDLGTRLAAPFCAGLLGEMGAEVIKIEQPAGGDMMRTIGPFVTDGEGDDATEYSLFWSVEGRGRKSVTLDLRRPEGQAILRTLAASSDVLVENFRPGTLERWNVGPDDLDPKLVIVRISVFGQDGPYRERPGLDRLGIAYGGLLNLTGYPDEPPVRPGLSISDYLTGVFAAQGAIAALYERDARGGRGQVVDAPLYGSILRINEWTLAAYDQLGTVRSRNGNRMENSAPIDNYSSADGQLRLHRRGRRCELPSTVRRHGSARRAQRSSLRDQRPPSGTC